MFSLDLPLEEIKGIGPRFLYKLSRLKIRTVGDLLRHFPNRYENWNKITLISQIKINEQAVIRGAIESIGYKRAWRRKIAIIEAVISDDSGSIRAVWFNQPYLRNVLSKGREAFFCGKVLAGKKDIYLSNPAYELINGQENQENKPPGLLPIYPETRGLTSKGIRLIIKKVLPYSGSLEEFIPEEILTEEGLPKINRAFSQIHQPSSLKQAESARRRFEFEELFLLQLNNLRQKLRLFQEKAPVILTEIEFVKEILSCLPFELTRPQKKSLWEILKDLSRPYPMNRLLQGDVGSGKTIVAAIAALVAAKNGYQSAFMAPTEVLANQHYQTLKKFFSYLDCSIALLTAKSSLVFYGAGLETEQKKAKLLEDIKTGKIKIVVGTHALIAQKKKLKKSAIVFNKLGFAVIDEQHRFGVEQRAELIRSEATIRSETTNLSESTTRSKTTNTFESTNEAANNKIVEKELSYKLVGIFYKAQEEIGRFCRERQYADLIEKKLKEEKIIFKREWPIEVADRKSNFTDFIIEGKILVDLKAKPFIEKSDYFQMKRYLEIANLELGVIVNFQDKYLKPKRVLGKKQFVDSGNFEVLNRYLPHFLSMSATPIPRTLAITVFGDLDLSIIDELPIGRKPIITKIVAPANRDKAYAFIRGQVRKGRQVFVICPRIEPNTQINADGNADERGYVSYEHRSALLWSEVKAVKEEYEKLSKEVFPDLKAAMLHGKMKAKEKNQIMDDFKAKKYDVLVSTSVIEVGVDVPNATIMLIEDADKFGLAQLYQFRGRVGRSERQSFCFLFTKSSTKTTYGRLKALLEAKNGFELAEKDLMIRGPGEFLGTEQAGLPDMAMKALKKPDLVKKSREFAKQILEKDPSLNSYPALKEKLANFQKETHLE